jgi:short-subunit dehydrogenase
MSIGACPYGQVYGAGKLWNDFMTSSLGYKLKNHNVDGSCFRPAGVVSGLVKADEGIPMTITAEECVKAVFSRMTAEVHHGHWKNELLGTVISSVNDMVPWFAEFAM